MSDMVDVDDINELAQFIRQTNGNNDLGAAALAERILEWQAQNASDIDRKSQGVHDVVAFWDGGRRATADPDEPQRVGWKTRIPLIPVTRVGPALFWVVESFGNPDNTPPLHESYRQAGIYANELKKKGWRDVKIIPLARLIDRS